MKQVTLKLFIALFFIVSMIVSCQKESAVIRDLPGVAQVEQTKEQDQFLGTAARGTSNCISCDTSTKLYDLTSKMKSFNFKPGLNVVSKVVNGYSAVAEYKGGKIVQWTLQDEQGKRYYAKSMRNTGRTFRVGGQQLNEVEVCFGIWVKGVCIGVGW